MMTPRLLLSIALGLATAGSVFAADALKKQAEWHNPDYPAIRQKVIDWMTETDPPEAQAKAVSQLWPEEAPDETPADLGIRILETVAVVDADARELAVTTLATSSAEETPQFPWLADSSKQYPSWIRDNLRFQYGRWLAEQRLLDEAYQQLKDIPVAEAADPAALLFNRAVCEHYLLKKKECVATLGSLLSNQEQIAPRYLAVSKLMLADIQPLETDSLDEVARLMRDIERRLDLGRAGKKVRTQEDDVVAKLDKMIEELEKQMQQQQQQSQGGQQGGSNTQPSSPLNDTMPAGGSGPGNVDPKKMNPGDNWGNLPPKERQEALQQISNEFPSHYRRVIEEYFRKLAREEESK
ncbi:hypothetical protein LOC68_27975 [Blastopirellula sp. JC732]|uniref:Secreted protein n=1 Tax=Blastopirellula sediminis TaxID=2894196 RepID=A0A9X1MTK4_9BACT|nr:hypothetical protein [Blastopirellula sediminis]MCC9604451.1 hypothetical protein [Blastopirellula sediminis]MCC9632250.1 hypothetical protein [Blastopirellula sediminis]